MSDLDAWFVPAQGLLPFTIEEVYDFFARVSLVVSCIALGLAAIRLPFVLRRWLAVRRSYGEWPSSLAADVENFAEHGLLKAMNFVPKIAAFGVLLGLIAVAAIMVEERTIWIGRPLEWTLYFASCLAVAVVGSYEVSIPPSILLLGPSSAEMERELAALNRDFPQYRTISLLRPNQAKLFGWSRWRAFANNFRTRDVYQWRTRAFQFMDVVPAIVMCEAENAPVVEEVRRIARWGFENRTFRMQHAKLSDPSERKRMREWLKRRLESKDTLEERKERLRTLDSINSYIVSEPRYPRSPVEFVLKLQALHRCGFARFFERCKSVSEDEGRSMLLEDVPSKVSLDEEKAFFRDDRVFEEIEMLLRSVDEVVMSMGYSAHYNSANLDNKRGWLARLRGQWADAELYIQCAISQFKSMVDSPDQDHAGAALREIGTAYYNLGDISFARFRETGDGSFLDEAEERFRLSFEFDERGLGDTSLAERRLSTVAKVRADIRPA